MIDKSKVKKMLVWDSGRTEGQKLYVIDICDDGCVAVRSDCEEDFLVNKTYETITWDHCKPIKEPTLNDLPEGWEDAWYRRKTERKERRIVGINPTKNLLFISVFGAVCPLLVCLDDLREDWQIKIDKQWHDCSEYLGE